MIVDVEPSRSILSAEVGASRTMLDRVKDRFDLQPERVIADPAYGSAKNLGWLLEHGIAPRIPVIDQSGRKDRAWSRGDFEWDARNDQYVYPAGQSLKQFRRNFLIQTVNRPAKVSPSTEH